MRIAFLVLLVLSLFLLPNGIGKSLAARPSVVNIRSILQLNSTTGGVSDVAIRAAVEDINLDPTVLNGTTLQVQTRDTNCNDGFLGMVQGRPSLTPPPPVFNTLCFHFIILVMMMQYFFLQLCSSWRLMLLRSLGHNALLLHISFRMSQMSSKFL
jgi:hypothetical protein